MRRVLEFLRRPRWLVLHALTDLVLVGLGVAVWWSETRQGFQQEFWPLWLILALVMPLFLHGAFVFATAPTPSRPVPGQPRSAAPPAGRMLATVLFTDIVGSTERAGEVGDRRWGELLDEHDRLARALIQDLDGRLIKSTGDGILATFERPGRAIGCAVALREGLRSTGVQIRAGVHSGEVEFRGSDVGGIAVHTAARVMGAAGAGEVLVSRTVRELVAGSDIAFEDRGAHRLKGLQTEWQLFAVLGHPAGQRP